MRLQSTSMGVVVVMVVAALALVTVDLDPGVLLLLVVVPILKPDICLRSSCAMGLVGRRPPPLLLLLWFLLRRRPRRRVRHFLGTLLVPVPEDDKDLLELVDIMDLLELDIIIIIFRADDCDVNRNKWGAAGILMLVPQLLAALA